MSFLQKDSLRTERVVLPVMHKPPLVSSIPPPPEEGGGRGEQRRRRKRRTGGFLMKSLTNEWVKIVYTMKFHSVIKNEITYLAAKLMELGNIYLD